jgi:DNA invertase Pin-like site-specific DNA recombinase
MNTQTAHSKMTPAHLRRQALVYIRQSTPHQVQSNQESTERQYALVQRAQHLGWVPEATVSVDEDQGRSGQGAQHRSGFQKLLADLSSGHVGMAWPLKPPDWRAPRSIGIA